LYIPGDANIPVDAEVEATIGQTIRKIGGHKRSYYIQDKIK